LFHRQRIAEEAKSAADTNQHGDAGDAKANKKVKKLVAALEEQTV
jgi:hypothetical protein